MIKKYWLITYRLWESNRAGNTSTVTKIIQVPPQIWWQDEIWKERQGDHWDGCTILMVHEFEEHEGEE